jgi:hypothetical protein
MVFFRRNNMIGEIISPNKRVKVMAVEIDNTSIKRVVREPEDKNFVGVFRRTMKVGFR